MTVYHKKIWVIRKQPDYKDDLRDLLLSGISSRNDQSRIDFNIGYDRQFSRLFIL